MYGITKHLLINALPPSILLLSIWFRVWPRYNPVLLPQSISTALTFPVFLFFSHIHSLRSWLIPGITEDLSYGLPLRGLWSRTSSVWC